MNSVNHDTNHDGFMIYHLIGTALRGIHIILPRSYKSFCHLSPRGMPSRCEYRGQLLRFRTVKTDYLPRCRANPES